MTTGGKALGVVMSEQDFDSITVTTATIETLNATTQNITGGQIGASSTATVGFYGASVTTQPATVASVTTTGATSSTPFGYTTSTQADAIVTALNSVIAKLKTLGLIASA